MELNQNHDVRLAREELVGLLDHASTDETRPHVCGVYLDHGRRTWAATDGHRLAVLTRDKMTRAALQAARAEGTRRGVIFTRASLARVAKLTPASGAITFELGESGTWRAITLDKRGVPVGAALALDVATAAQFPPWADVFPTASLDVPEDEEERKIAAPRAIAWAANGQYISDAFAFVGRGGEIQKTNALVVAPESPSDPITIRDAAGCRWAVVMPVRW